MLDEETFHRMRDAVFRRLTGVKKATFLEMQSVLEAAEERKKAHGGRLPTLPVRERLLMTLEYWREYRTYLHIAQGRGVSESSAWQSIRWCEDTLIKSGQFTLPGKKSLRESGRNYEVVLVDATETPVERPKKSNAAVIRARKDDTR